ncbi:serine hydrolase domain-containing protein [Sphingobacterium sp. LRF_L2]|uniref:serine hydrolase domain-containing protein n=1 Tax=Sphingobacterium sp. LRF_L2 TaxID=3369421 RepID=UPI003F5E7658
MKWIYRCIGLIILLLAFDAVGQVQYKQTLVNHTKLLQDAAHFIPLTNLDRQSVVVVSPFPTRYQPFVEMLRNYVDLNVSDFNQYDENVKGYNTVVVVGTNTELRGDLLVKIRQSMAEGKQVILVQFGDLAEKFPWIKTDLPLELVVLHSRYLDIQAQQNAAMSLLGGLAITEGKLKTSQTRLQYTNGVGAGLNITLMTKKIDEIAEEAIKGKATPGMVVMAVKNGQVIFNKAYGSHTYGGKRLTSVNDIFDLASVSKIVGTTPVIMHLTEMGLIRLDSTIGTYLPEARGTNKDRIPLRSVLLHEAGFTPFIPFYRALKEGDLLRFSDKEHQVVVADSAYLRNNYYRNVMWPEMLHSAVKPVGTYLYSDLSMYVMKEIAEHETQESLDKYVQHLLFKPIGMKTAGYNPRQVYPKERMVPTERDTSFRKVLLQGYVHDQGAAMAGGVAGHAGLFATANDLAIYGQLLLNRGTYGGIRYFKPETVDLFTSKQSTSSRRGLGFDRADPDPKKAYPSKLANESVFGHTGYTGTCIWIDPKNQLVYIFLSNRVHPQVTTRLLDMNIRGRIQDAIYETIHAER